MSVSVKIEFYGSYAQKTGKSYEELHVSEKLQEAYDWLVKYLKEQYKITPPYILMFGKTHITGALNRQEDIPLKDGDVFKVVPSISGG